MVVITPAPAISTTTITSIISSSNHGVEVNREAPSFSGVYLDRIAEEATRSLPL